MREFSRASMGIDGFRDEFVDEVYNIDEGQVFRKRDKLERAFRYVAMALTMHPLLCLEWQLTLSLRA